MTNGTTRRGKIEDCPDYPLTKRITELESQLVQQSKFAKEQHALAVKYEIRAYKAEAGRDTCRKAHIDLCVEHEEVKAENKRLKAKVMELNPCKGIHIHGKDYSGCIAIYGDCPECGK